MAKIVNDNYKYAKCAVIIGDRKQLTEERIEELEEVLGDTAQAQAVVAASKSSMGEYAVIDMKADVNKYACK